MTVLITAGPTRESIDPVRYLTNRSSGKMGYALADVAAAKGNRVILISGPTDSSLEVPDGVDFILVESAAEMYAAVERWIGKADIAIFAAAVADYRPVECSEQKIKKVGDEMVLKLVRNADILGSVRGKFLFEGTLVGFAAETENVVENARGKLLSKGCDMVVANDVSRKDIGFDSDENEVMLVFRDDVEKLAKTGKVRIAKSILRVAFGIEEDRLRSVGGLDALD
jgi:phosphopantothenoylcysteine decarboxylase/phosphopantothenate--cysteine ligase